VISSSTFGERFVVANFADEGVVADLETGNYFRVDGVTARVCEILVSQTDSAIDRVASRLGVDATEAARIVTGILEALDTTAVRGTPTGSYHFRPEEGGYDLWHGAKRVLSVRGDDLDICVPPDSGAAKSPHLELYVRAIAPKIMFLRGITVVHASACVAHGALVAFSGQSGAGKTTTARVFAQAGAQLVSEDLLIFKPKTPAPSVVLGSEARVFTWAKTVTDAFVAGARRLPSIELETMADGQDQRLAALHFLNVNRRKGAEFATRSLNGADALLALMANHFLGDASRDGWRRFFAIAQEWARSVALIEVVAPAGLAALSDAATRYMSTWTSYAPTGAGEPPSQA
jgi:hypothetical protein